MVPHPDSFDAAWQLLRRHPDFSFGVVFVKHDWPRQQPPVGVEYDEIEARLSQQGYDIIDVYSDPEPDTIDSEEPPCEPA